MPNEKKTFPWYWLSIPLIFIIAIIVFLTTKDCYQQYCITGWEALKLQWPSFWIWAIGGLVAAVILLLIARNTEQVGGSSSKVMALVIVAAILLTAPWGKACTDKANGGVTAPGYKSQPAP